jgi:hypothetical protein
LTTLGDLRNRVILETVRDDLADDLASILDLQIASAIAYYQNERFWFNESRTTGTMTALNEYTALPSGYLFIDAFYIVIGGVRYWLKPRSMEDIESLYTVPQVGQPTDYANFSGQARLWPTPNMNYQTIWLTVSEVTPPLDFTVPGVSNTSTNDWMENAYDLITARVKINLYRDQFRDDSGLQGATLMEREAYSNLKGQSNRQLSTGRIRASW